MDIFDRKKKVLDIFLNGPISGNSIFFSKIFQEKVMVINFCFIVNYQLNIDMRSTRHENIEISFLCKKNRNNFFLILFSCNQNCEVIFTEVEEDGNSFPRNFIKTTRPIAKGEQIFLNYGKAYFLNQNIVCMCKEIKRLNKKS